MRIKPFTLSLVVGSSACNASCPFCVSKVTTGNGVTHRPVQTNWRNWEQTILLCKRTGVTTVLLTGKGEPTLFPQHMNDALNHTMGHFPITELQTNAIPIMDFIREEGSPIKDGHLDLWFDMGLRTIAISNCGFDFDLNRQIYTPHRKEYPIDWPQLVDYLHGKGFSIRLATVMVRGGIDTLEKVDHLVSYAKALGIEQVTLRPVTSPIGPSTPEAQAVWAWIMENKLDEREIVAINNHISLHSTKLLELPHGAEIYDMRGQNVCITNCLTESVNPNTIRQLIYFPDGHLRYSWQYEGAILL